MQRSSMAMACTCDLAGQVRGRGFMVRDIEQRAKSGVGWAPTKSLITAFGTLAESPWGASGDLLLMPDPKTKVNVEIGEGEPELNFYLADLCYHDGRPWECCPRAFLRRALATLEEEAGLLLRAAFEHEFHYEGVSSRPNGSYGLGAWQLLGRFPERLCQALERAGVEPETLMPEFGLGQYEVTCAADIGIAAADRAVIVREITRAVAHSLGCRASFTPLVAIDAPGNGAHIHMSLLDSERRPVTYDPAASHGISDRVAPFFAGILHYLPAICALTAPSCVSYLRLTPQRYSAYYNNLGLQHRESALRICPVASHVHARPAMEQINIEFRVADAAASPYIALGALVWAGIAGLRQGLPLPAPTEQDLDSLSLSEKKERGMVRLPQSLATALGLLERLEEAPQWLGERLFDIYLRHKRAELSEMRHLEPRQQIQRYKEVY